MGNMVRLFDVYGLDVYIESDIAKDFANEVEGELIGDYDDMRYEFSDGRVPGMYSELFEAAIDYEDDINEILNSCNFKDFYSLVSTGVCRGYENEISRNEKGIGKFLFNSTLKEYYIDDAVSSEVKCYFEDNLEESEVYDIATNIFNGYGSEDLSEGLNEFIYEMEEELGIHVYSHKRDAEDVIEGLKSNMKSSEYYKRSMVMNLSGEIDAELNRLSYQDFMFNKFEDGCYRLEVKPEKEDVYDRYGLDLDAYYEALYEANEKEDAQTKKAERDAR